ncbi:MAG TPA: hypothetical protein VLA89_18800 [Gemmatimonadales bacterium]|nr:hypothetical protein [Gemmatimonadales bacterium]
MIRPDTRDYIARVVDPELQALRETRDALAKRLAMLVKLCQLTPTQITRLLVTRRSAPTPGENRPS